MKCHKCITIFHSLKEEITLNCKSSAQIINPQSTRANPTKPKLTSD